MEFEDPNLRLWLPRALLGAGDHPTPTTVNLTESKKPTFSANDVELVNTIRLLPLTTWPEAQGSMLSAVRTFPHLILC